MYLGNQPETTII